MSVTAESPPSGRPTATTHGVEPAPASLVPVSGWHFLHLFFRVDRGALAKLSDEEKARGRAELIAALDRSAPGVPEQLQAFVMVGHKADFGVVMAGPDLRAIHDVQTRIQASALGPALVATYSFYSITEISEYVPDVEAYGKILREREGVDPESPAYKTKLAQYANRLGPMNKQRLTPEFPDWPIVCFYPMSKTRVEGQNWYTEPFDRRAEMMSGHGKSGMKFAGKVSQVITASTGLDDWEWGVTLWARNPSFLKDIVYTMRFDESSARYALFGPFYPGFILPPAEVVAALRV
jgi:hydrogen peroxide-dependent heme synthase